MIIKAEDISKTYFRKSSRSNYFYAVNKTSFVLEGGKLAVILGRSGSGKSTFLNMIAGLLKPSSGRILYGDTDIYSMNDKELSVFRNKNIGMIPQVQSVLPNLTVSENIKLPYTLYRKDDNIEGYASELMELVGISHLKDVDASDLSGGEMRRVAIARALIQKPGIILADEPTSDLDDENTENVFKIFRSITEKGISVLIVTHETESKSYADSVYRMNSGELIREEQ